MGRFTQQTHQLVKNAFFQFVVLIVTVGTTFLSSCTSSDDVRENPNYRIIEGNYYLNKVDYFSEYYLVQYNEETQLMEKVFDEPIQLIDWKKGYIYITTPRIDFLEINTGSATPEFLKNSTTEPTASHSDFTLKEPHHAWEILLKKSGNKSKYYQMIVGFTVIIALVAALLYILKMAKSRAA